jgi:hypothetical protein
MGSLPYEVDNHHAFHEGDKPGAGLPFDQTLGYPACAIRLHPVHARWSSGPPGLRSDE